MISHSVAGSNAAKSLQLAMERHLADSARVNDCTGTNGQPPSDLLVIVANFLPAGSLEAATHLTE